MITIITIPKAFAGLADIHQRNAIGSWRQVFPDAQIILCGRDAGVDKAASDFGCEYWPEIAKTEYGTPLVSAALEHAEQVGMHRLIAFINADIIVCSDLLHALSGIRMRRFLAVSRRWDLDIAQAIDFSNPNWEGRLREDLRAGGKAHPPSGSDLFVFPRGIAWQMPPFAVGRPGWDNWFIYRARALVGTVIDMTRSVTLLHQNHDYRHVPAARTEEAWDGPEADKNRSYIQGYEQMFFLDDATHATVAGRVRPDFASLRLEQRIARQSLLDLSRTPWAIMRRLALRYLLRHKAAVPNALWVRMVYGLSL